MTGYKIDIKPESQVEFVDSEGDDIETNQDIDDSNELSNEETTESTVEQLEEDSSDDFPNEGDVGSALDDDANKDEEQVTFFKREKDPNT